MDVIENYFRTLRLFLPKKQRDDIIRELVEEMRSKTAEQEGVLGRPLNADEQAAIVAQYGHPLLTAARYRPSRHLIGPIVFPYYWIALKVSVGLVAVGHFIGALILFAGDASVAQVGEAVEQAVATILKVAAWITVLGAGADFWLTRSQVLENWSPRRGSQPQRRVSTLVERALNSVPGRNERQRSPHPLTNAEPSFTRFVVSLMIGVWWLVGLRFPVLFFGPGASSLEWGSAMDRVYPVLVVAQMAMLAEQFVRLTQTTHAMLRATRVVWLLAGAALVYLVATTDHQWMVWQEPAAARGNAVVFRVARLDITLATFVNEVWSTIFVAVALVSIWGGSKAVLRRFARPALA